LFVDEEYPMLARFCKHFAAWRTLVSRMKTIDEADAKIALLMLFYGGRDFEDLPCLRKLADEVRLATQAILGHPSSSSFLRLYSDRPRPDLSRLCAILSFEEHEAGLLHSTMHCLID
jgi:hypothetical protein